ncbi:pentraxin-related protein PTX3 [Protopterus annectens]|uniref:pentraxin-related protein PTX3 n=1 Tax=Protopterus annectens TaxID=7888 RepID=UPI001CF98DAD|nr:pentraxin-related protein PTX3 [Protopterus annectens]
MFAYNIFFLVLLSTTLSWADPDLDNAIENDYMPRMNVMREVEGYNYEYSDEQPTEDAIRDESDCQETRSKWDKLFIMLENSQMKENMLLQSINEILMMEMQSLHGEMVRFASSFAATCARAIDTATSSVMQLEKKMGTRVQQMLETKLIPDNDQGKILLQLVKTNEDLLSKVNNLESAWQNSVLRGTQTFTPFHQQNDAQLTTESILGSADPLQKSQLTMQYFMDWLDELLLLRGCEMALAFPMHSKKTFASVSHEIGMNLNSFTACMWAKPTDVLNKTILMSYGTRRNPYEIQLYLNQKSAVLTVGDNENKVIAENVTTLRKWAHICGTWDSNEGHAAVWVNGQNGANSNGIAEGHRIPDGGILQLGQEKNGCCVGGGFDEKLSFAGKLTGFNIWGRVLNEEEILNLYNGKTSCESTGNVVGWGVSEIIPHGGITFVFSNQ